jgi:hypothetical protein
MPRLGRFPNIRRSSGKKLDFATIRGWIKDSPFNAKRVKGIEPSCPAWEAGVLPLNYTRVRRISDFRFRIADWQQAQSLPGKNIVVTVTWLARYSIFSPVVVVSITYSILPNGITDDAYRQWRISRARLIWIH